MPGKLIVVALPIGNPEDLSPRARLELNAADIILTEDTRKFRALSKRVSLPRKQLYSYHEHNETESTEEVILFLKKGLNVALTCDAGTPSISDPGFRLIQRSILNDIAVSPIPGPSAVITALSVCPLGGTEFFFGGFPPKSSIKRTKYFEKIKTYQTKTVLYESPHRILNHLLDAQKVFGDTSCFVARELTKKYQELEFDAISNIIKKYKKKPAKGELVLIYPVAISENFSQSEIDELILSQLKASKRIADIILEVKGKTKQSKKDLYRRILVLKKSLLG